MIYLSTLELSPALFKFLSKALEASELESLTLSTFVELRALYCVFVE